MTASRDLLNEGLFPMKDFVTFFRALKDHSVATPIWDLVQSVYDKAFSTGTKRLIDVHIESLKAVSSLEFFLTVCFCRKKINQKRKIKPKIKPKQNPKQKPKLLRNQKENKSRQLRKLLRKRQKLQV